MFNCFLRHAVDEITVLKNSSKRKNNNSLKTVNKENRRKLEFTNVCLKILSCYVNYIDK